MKKKLIILLSCAVALVMIFAGCSSSNDATMESVSTKTEAAYDYDEIAGEEGFAGTTSISYDSDESYAEDVEYETEESYDDSSDEAEDLSEKIIYDVYTSMQVDDVDIAVASITAKVESLGGYISYANTYSYDSNEYASLEVRVPSDKLSEMENFTYDIGDVESYTKSSENITDDYYDIVSRLESAEAEEEQLLEILDKAETIEDILLVREQLSSVQSQIESYKGKIRLWDSLVDYSTITYYIEPIPTLDTETDDSPRLIKMDETWRAMKKGFKNSAIAVANFFSFLLRALAVLFIPLVICGVLALIIIIIIKTVEKKKKAKKEKEQK